MLQVNFTEFICRKMNDDPPISGKRMARETVVEASRKWVGEVFQDGLISLGLIQHFLIRSRGQFFERYGHLKKGSDVFLHQTLFYSLKSLEDFICDRLWRRDHFCREV